MGMFLNSRIPFESYRSAYIGRIFEGMKQDLIEEYYRYHVQDFEICT